MTARIEKGKLIIELPVLPQPISSSTGKTLLVATTHGAQPTTVSVDGRIVKVSVNAFISAK